MIWTDTGLARTRVLHTGPTVPRLNTPVPSFTLSIRTDGSRIGQGLVRGLPHFRHLVAHDVPHKSDQFPRNGDAHQRGVLARLD